MHGAGRNYLGIVYSDVWGATSLVQNTKQTHRSGVIT